MLIKKHFKASECQIFGKMINFQKKFNFEEAVKLIKKF